MYNFKVWVYTPCGEGKVELFKPVNDFNKDMILVKDVRILVWANRLTELRALIKTRETLIEEPKESQHNFFILIDAHIGLTLKLNTTNMNVVTLSNLRLFVLRKNILLL